MGLNAADGVEVARRYFNVFGRRQDRGSQCSGVTPKLTP